MQKSGEKMAEHAVRASVEDGGMYRGIFSGFSANVLILKYISVKHCCRQMRRKQFSPRTQMRYFYGAHSVARGPHTLHLAIAKIGISPKETYINITEF